MGEGWGERERESGWEGGGGGDRERGTCSVITWVMRGVHCNAICLS